MSAGVHEIDFLAVVHAFGGGGERQAGGFLYRQRVHVGSQRDAAAGPGAFEDADNAGAGDAGADFEAERAEMLGDERRGAGFLVAELGMLVKVAAPGDEFGFDGRGAFADLGFESGLIGAGDDLEGCEADSDEGGTSG